MARGPAGCAAAAPAARGPSPRARVNPRTQASLFTPVKALDAHAFVASSLSVYPLLCVLLTKYVYRAALADCFFASLHEVNPQQAAQLAKCAPEHKRGVREKLRSWVATEDTDEPQQVRAPAAARGARGACGLAVGRAARPAEHPPPCAAAPAPPPRWRCSWPCPSSCAAGAAAP